ncbi:hypothetical protein IKP13_00605 [bacterium]|nr:hypothetical protein [bacterium]
MEGSLKSLCFDKLLILLAFITLLVQVSLFAAEGENPTVDVTFKKSGKSVVYTITYGKNTKFNDNEAAPYKFLFLDSGKKELGKIERAFFAKNKEGKAEYTSDFGESSAKITLPVCLYNEKTGLAEKCTVKNLKLEIK